MVKVDQTQLAGLKYRGNNAVIKNKDGRKTTVYEQVERDLKVSDILDSKETPSGVVIVTADGQKITLSNKKAV